MDLQDKVFSYDCPTSYGCAGEDIKQQAIKEILKNKNPITITLSNGSIKHDVYVIQTLEGVHLYQGKPDWFDLYLRNIKEGKQ